jgi:hypothetical protein
MLNILEVMILGHFRLVIIIIPKVMDHLLIHIKEVNIKREKRNSMMFSFFLGLTSAKDLEIIARRHDFETLYSTTDKNESKTKPSISNTNFQWMNAGVLFTDKTIESDLTGIYQTGL